MSKEARSARGQRVNFDLLKIKQQLATQPVSVGVNNRRKFIDEKDGVKSRVQENYIDPPTDAAIPDALGIAKAAAEQSAKAAAQKPPAKKD
jgi:hypothetical protein